MSSRQRRLGRAAVNSTLAVILVLMATLSPFVGAPATNVAASAVPAVAVSSAAVHADSARLKLERMGLAFEPNVGQMDAAVRFRARGMGGTLSFMPGQVVLALPTAPTEAIVKLQFEDANAASGITGLDRLPGVVNIIRGNDPTQWHVDIPTFAGVRYQELYPGIALDYVGTEGTLKGTYQVQPGADPGRIRWRYSGVSEVRLDEPSGELHVGVRGKDAHAEPAELVETAPVAWQMNGERRTPIKVAYRVGADGTVSLKVGEYDRTKPLTIDPTIRYSTFLGGSAYDEAMAVALDKQGNTYITGYTTSSDWPTVNPFDPSLSPLEDVLVVKLSPEGNTRLYSTYLGGTGNDVGYGIAVDSNANAYVAGWTQSGDWPLAGPLQSLYSNPNGLAFVAKLTPGGNGLIYSTYLGGVSKAEARAIAVDIDGNAYVTGYSGPGFPLVDPYQAGLKGGNDVFVSKLDPAGSRLVYSTFLGGSSNDIGYGIAVDWEGNVYLTGATMSIDWPAASPYQAACKLGGGGACNDAFVAKLNAAGSGLVYSSFFGSSGTDVAHAIAIDAEENAVIVGATNGLDLPTVNPTQPAYGGGRQDTFVAKFNSTGGVLFSTYLGGSGDEDMFASNSGVTADRDGNFTVVGSTTSTNFPIQAPLYLNPYVGSTESFVTQYRWDGVMTFSTYLGGVADTAAAHGVAADGRGDVVVAGVTRASNFPTVNAAQPVFGGGTADAFVTRINIGAGSSVEFTPVNLTFDQARSGTTSLPQTVMVHNIGLTPTLITTATVVGPNPLDFAISDDTCSGSTLAVDATCSISVTFSPQASGMRDAKIALSSPDWPVIKFVPVRGKGAPTITISPGPLNFPMTKPTTQSPVLTETVRNVGLEPLTMGTETITGTHPSSFSIVTDQCAGATIPSGGTCAIGVRFTPGAIGQRFARLSVDNPLFDRPETAPLTGLGGTTPSLSLSEEDTQWGLCRGNNVRVHGANFPPYVFNTSQGYHQIFVDGRPVGIPMMSGDDGSFDDWITIPNDITGTMHVITAADTVLPSYTAGVGFRSPDRDLPVIFIPGVSGSYLNAGSDQLYWAPPDWDLAGPVPDDRQLIPLDIGLAPGKTIWIDGGSALSIILGTYRLLDPLQLQPDGLTPKPDMFGTIPDVRVGDVLWDLNLGPIHKDFYLTLRETLTATRALNGYPQDYRDSGPNRNLYYFPYDWRKDISLTGPQLAAMVDEALRTSGKDKVVLLAHSMGGLVARNYLVTYGASKVDQLITIATPFLGSPLVAKAEEIGDEWGIGGHLGDIGWGMHPKEMKKLAQNMTAAYELMPSQYYFTSNPFDPPGFEPSYLERSYFYNGRLIDEKLDYVASQAFMASRHNATLATQGEVFRNKGIGDLSIISGQIYHQRIIGTDVPTLDKIVMSPRAVCTDVPWVGTICLPLPEYKWVELGTFGDGTVPLHSALGYRAPHDDRNYFVPNATHNGLTSDSRTLMMVGEMLQGRLCSASGQVRSSLTSMSGQAATNADPSNQADVSADPGPSLVTGVEVAAMGSATLTAFDSSGNQTGAVEGKSYVELNHIPGANYTSSDGGQFIALTASDTYTIVMRGMSPDGVAELHVNALADGSTTQATIFSGVPMTGTTMTTLTLTLPGPIIASNMTYQYEPGAPVQQVGVKTVLTGTASQDLIPPKTSATIDANRVVTLTATDTGGSGLQGIRYSTETPPVHWQDYTGPIQLPAVGSVTAFATDQAGNVEYPPAQVTVGHRVYLPLVIR